MFFCWVLVLDLRSSRVVSVPVLFMALSSFWPPASPAGAILPLALSALAVSLRSSRVLSDEVDGCAVGQQIGNQASFDPRNYGYATLTKLLKATELFQLDKEGTSEVSVRDIREVRGAKA